MVNQRSHGSSAPPGSATSRPEPQKTPARPSEKGRQGPVAMRPGHTKNHEEESKLKAEEFIKRAEQQAIEKISRAEKMAISKVNDEIVNNSVNIAEKIISENINDQSADKLVKQSIDQISKLKV